MVLPGRLELLSHLFADLSLLVVAAEAVRLVHDFVRMVLRNECLARSGVSVSTSMSVADVVSGVFERFASAARIVVGSVSCST
jgi:hypothetical protein